MSYFKILENRNAFLLILIVFSISSCSRNGNRVNDSGKDEKTLLFRKETRELYSEIVKDSFQIHVSLPAAYYMTDTVYPVIYSTDANRSFGIISDVVNALSFPVNNIPELIVVGIGYPIKGLEEWAARRHNDMTPTWDSIRSLNWKQQLEKISGRDNLVVRSGQSKEFLEFIKKELIPYIESEYRASNSDRAIFGYSLGGLFSMYVLFESPGTFQQYFAGSPTLRWGEGFLLEMENKYAKDHNRLDANLFMSIGEYEDNPWIWKMDSSLRARDYAGLKIYTMEFPGQTHQTCYPEAVTEALMILYNEDKEKL